MSVTKTLMVPIEVTIFDDTDSCIPGFHESTFVVIDDVIEDVLSCMGNRAKFAVTLHDRSINHGYALNINVTPAIQKAIEELVKGPDAAYNRALEAHEAAEAETHRRLNP